MINKKFYMLGIALITGVLYSVNTPPAGPADDNEQEQQRIEPGELLKRFIHLIREAGSVEDLQAILNQYPNFDINASDMRTGNTPLMVAILENRFDIVKFIVEALEPTTVFPPTPQYLNETREQERMSIDRANPRSGRNALQLAASRNNSDIVHYLLLYGASPFIDLSVTNNLEVLKQLVEAINEQVRHDHTLREYRVIYLRSALEAARNPEIIRYLREQLGEHGEVQPVERPRVSRVLFPTESLDQDDLPLLLPRGTQPPPLQTSSPSSALQLPLMRGASALSSLPFTRRRQRSTSPLRGRQRSSSPQSRHVRLATGDVSSLDAQRKRSAYSAIDSLNMGALQEQARQIIDPRIIQELLYYAQRRWHEESNHDAKQKLKEMVEFLQGLTGLGSQPPRFPSLFSESPQ